MLIKDPGVIALVLKVADQYNENIATRFLRPYLTGILSEGELSRQVSALTEQTDAVSTQGIHLDELYRQIHGMARFIYLVRVNVLPNIRNMAGSTGNDSNKIYRDMAVNNFGANLSILADLVNELYIRAVEYDQRKNPKGRTVGLQIPELAEIGRYLIGK